MKKSIPRYIGVPILLIFIGIVVFLFFNSYDSTRKYYQNSLNGVVDYKFQSYSGVLVKFYDIEDYVDLHIDSSEMYLIENGDSIFKPTNSEKLYLFKKDTSEFYPKYLYLKNMEFYK